MFGRERSQSKSLILYDKEKENVNTMIEEQANRFKGNDDDFYLTSMIKRHENEITKSNYDAINAKIAFSKYLAVRNVLAFVAVIVIISNNTSFDMSYKLGQHESTGNLILMLIVTILKVVLILLYLKSVQLWGIYLKKIEKLEEGDSVFADKGYGMLITTCVLFFIHPFYWLHNIQVEAFTESYFSGDGVYLFYQRDINQYFYLMQFAVLFWLVFFIILENTYFAATRSQRVCKMFGFDNDILFVVKCVLSAHGEIFVFLLLIFLMYYFATLFNYSEIGYALSLKVSDFNTAEEYQSAFADASGLVNYYNTYWNVVITMTTIGYGDMYTRATLSRCILFCIAICGAVIFPILIVTVSNLFELSRNEADSMDLQHKVIAKTEAQHHAALLVVSIMRLTLAKKKKNKDLVERYANEVAVRRKIFSQAYKNYRNLFFITELGDLVVRIEKTTKKYNILRNHFLPHALEERDSEKESNKSE